MSIFSKIKRSKNAAQKHKVQTAEKQKEEEIIAKLPIKYKHVPTHAAVDALSGAPSSWGAEDRPKIREQHKRRSEMAISRTASTLSGGSSMAAGHVRSASVLPRHASYSSFSPSWNDRIGDLHFMEESKGSTSRSGKKHSYHDSGIGPSPLASHIHSEAASTVNSSGTSTTSSSDNLPELHSRSSRLQPTTFAEKDIFQRLHTSTTRKVGEAPLSASPRFPSPPLVKPIATATIVAQEAKPKKPRWSLMHKQSAMAAA